MRLERQIKPAFGDVICFGESLFNIAVIIFIFGGNISGILVVQLRSAVLQSIEGIENTGEFLIFDFDKGDSYTRRHLIHSSYGGYLVTQGFYAPEFKSVVIFSVAEGNFRGIVGGDYAFDTGQFFRFGSIDTEDFGVRVFASQNCAV